MVAECQGSDLESEYEPLTVCNIKKAMVLIILGKAELIQDDKRKEIRTVKKAYPGQVLSAWVILFLSLTKK